MKIYWASVRKASDLCSTTTHALLEGLVRLGHEVVFLSPEPFQDTVAWTNITLQQSSVKGFHALSLATSARKWLEQVEAHANQCIIIDWPLAPRLGPLLKKRGHRLVLMDRSPPADASVLGLLQWRHWKKAWRLVGQEVFSDGFVVSDMHLQFSSEYCKREKSIHILPAGVDISLFSAVLDTICEVFNTNLRGKHTSRDDSDTGSIATRSCPRRAKPAELRCCPRRAPRPTPSPAVARDDE